MLISCTSFNCSNHDAVIEQIIILGLNHEQQHQELMLMDIKYNFSVNPYFHNIKHICTQIRQNKSAVKPLKFIDFEQAISKYRAANADQSNLLTITSNPSIKY